MPLVPLTTRKQYIDSLQPLRPSSTQGSCPICQDNYSREYPPVRLPGCGHIFCRSCILEWFRSGQSNSNTCPLDRTVLFALPPPTPSTDNALEHLPRQRRNAQQFVTLLQDGSIISVNGNLTREGCRILLLDLWYFTYQLYRRVDFDDLDGMPIPERVLRQPIEDSVPRGVSIPRRVWWSLVSIARHMMVMHREDWPAVGTLPQEDLEDFTDEVECEVECVSNWVDRAEEHESAQRAGVWL